MIICTMYKSEEKKISSGLLQFFYMLQTKVEITGRADEFQILPKLEKQRICPIKALVCVT